MADRTTAGFHHVALVTGDAQKSQAFYQDVLGLRRLEDGRARTGDLWFGDAAGAPGTLVVVREEPGATHGNPGIGGIHHTAFGVQTEDAVLMWKRRLVDSGWAVTGPYDRGYFTSIYFRDPDGQVLEIATAGPGYTIDEAPESLGSELVHPPQRIVRGHRDEAAIAALTHDEPVPDIAPDMELHGIHHITGITDDLGRAGEFYERALGLKLIKKTTNRDDPQQLHYFWANYADGQLAPHSSFTLFGWPSEWKDTRAGIGQTHHVAFRARDREDLLAWQDHLRSLGCDVAHSNDSIRFHAPDGLLLEITTDEDS